MNTIRQNFIKQWNNASEEERKTILREIKWERGEISKGFYDDKEIKQMSCLGISTDRNKLNGTIAKDLVKRALESKIPEPPEGCLPRLPGMRR